MLKQTQQLMRQLDLPEELQTERYLHAFSMLVYPTAFKGSLDDLGFNDLKPIFFNIFKENSYNLKLQFFKDPLI